MKTLLKLLLPAAALLTLPTKAAAQDTHIPCKFAVAIGGGLSLPDVNAGYNTFFCDHPHRAGLSLTGDATYYINKNVGVGMQYNRSQFKAMGDKASINFIAPKGTLRYVDDNGKQGVFASLGLGLLNYHERMYNTRIPDMRSHSKYTKNYFAADISLGYEFAILPGVSGMIRGDVITADWFFNPNYRYSDDEGEDNQMFKNNITIFNLSFALSFGL